MPKADVLALATTLSGTQVDAVTLERYYRDAVYDFARKAYLTAITEVSVVAGTPTVTFPTPAVDILDVIFDARVLDPAELDDLEAARPGDWRDEKGLPVAWVPEDEQQRTFRLYPIPDTNSKALSFPHGEPLGEDYPVYDVAIFHTETRTDVPPWLEAALAFAILVPEFGRESNHQDPIFAKMCAMVAGLMLQMVSTGEE